MIKKFEITGFIPLDKEKFPCTVRIKDICNWSLDKYKKLLEKKGFRLYIFIRLAIVKHDRGIGEPSTLVYLFKHILD